jgi:hypothetical protein
MLRAMHLSLPLFVAASLTALAGCQTQHNIGKQPQERAAAPVAPAPRGLPEGSAEGLPEHLLHEYTAREAAPAAEIRTWDLPAKAKRLVVELLISAAHDDTSRLPELMTEQSRWGVPDRREFDARPVFDGDAGRVFLDTLRGAASRLSRKENLNCPPIMPPVAQTYVRNGSEPMWCFYGSNDGLDILAFKLVLESGSARVDYVGMLTERPTRMSVRNGVQPPPMTPIVRRPPGTAERMPGLPEGAIPMPPPGTGGPLIINPAATPDSPVTTPIVVPGAPPAPSPVKATEPAASPATSPAKATEPAATKPASKPADPKAKAEEPAPTPAPSI